MLVRLFVLIMAFTTVRGVWLRFFPEGPEPSIASQVTGVLTCRNAQGMEFVTSDEAECRKFEASYACEVDENSYLPVADATACKAKQDEAYATKLKEFNVNEYAEAYKYALDAKGRGY